MRLAEPLAVLQAMGIPESTGSTANALAALDLTAPIIEAMLDTGLDEQETLDAFDFSIVGYEKTPPTFRLQHGFVNREEAITLGGVAEGLVLADTFSVDYERGLLTAKVVLDSGELTVQYTRGFPTKGTNKVLDTTPDWLRQAGVMAAVHYLQITPANIVNKMNVSMADVTNPIRVMLSRVLNPKSRPRHNLEFAARSQTVE